MKRAKIRDWLEIIGIFAVVLSLVFVGLQMRQTQELAIAEMDWNNMIAEIESRSAIYEFPVEEAVRTQLAVMDEMHRSSK